MTDADPFDQTVTLDQGALGEAVSQVPSSVRELLAADVSFLVGPATEWLAEGAVGRTALERTFECPSEANAALGVRRFVLIATAGGPPS